MRRSLCVASWCVSILAICFSQTASFAQVGTDAPPLEVDRPELIERRQPLTEAQDDAVTAAAYFAQARVLEQRNDRSSALRGYQRAWRYDSQNQKLLEEVVSLAFELQRPHVATRYALLAVERKPKDAILVRRLAIHLSKEDQNERAAKLFQLSLELSKDRGGPPSDLATALLLLELGRLQYKTGEFTASATTLARLRDALLDPTKAGLGDENAKTVLGAADQTWAMLGEVFLAAKRPEEATAAFRKAEEAKGDAALFAFRSARVEAAREKYEAALAQLDIYFAKQESSAGKQPYQLLREWLAKQIPDAKSAATAYREKLKQLAEKDPTNLPLSLALGESLAEQKDWPAAATAYRALLEKTPSAEAYAGLLAALTAAEDVAGLTKTLADIAQKTGTLAAVTDEVTALQKKKPLVEKLIATTEAELATEGKTLLPGQLHGIGLLAIEAKKFDAAEKLLQAAVKETKRKEGLYLNWGLALFRAEEPARAAKVFQTAIDEKAVPAKDGPIYYYLAGALELSGETDAALAAIQQAIAKQPGVPTFVSRKAWILYHAKRYPAAEAAYKALLKSFDDVHDDQELREVLREARLVLSNICLVQDKFPAAVEYLEQVLDEYPEHVGALNDLSYIWSERGLHLHRALKMAEEAVKAEPTNRSYRDTLAWAYYQLQQYPAALREIEQAVADQGADGVIFDHWGDILAKLGRRDEAHAAWQRALPFFETEAEAKQRDAVKAKLAQPPTP